MLIHQLLLHGAERHPNKVSLRWSDRDRALTYADAVEAMERAAGALAHLGIGPGDRVLIFAHNGLDYLIAMFGCWRIGAIAALVNVKFADDLAYYVADHQPKAIIYTHDMGEVVRQAMSASAEARHLVCMDGPQEGALGLPMLMEQKFAPPADPNQEDAIAHLSYTSGTTGRPKAACLAHEPTMRAARCIAERLRVRADDVSFGPTALSSSYQLVANLLPPLAQVATVNVMGKWTQSGGFDALAAAKATILVGNPPVITDLLRESRTRGKLPSPLRFVLSGGGAVPPPLKQALRDEFALPLVESYGQSEIGGFFALGYPELEHDDSKLGRIGPMLPDKEVAIHTTTGDPVPLGQAGEVVMRGGFMAGYWNRPEQTAAATHGGWLRSGDVGMFDADGYLTMRGRRAEIIRIAGKDWFPRDIEEALCRQPGVVMAALVGISSAKNGTWPIGFVTLEPDATCQPAELKAAITPQVAYDLSSLRIEVCDELPMTPTGKIAKAQLAEMANAKFARDMQ